MAQTRDWQGMKAMSARLLKERTGEDVDTWNQRIKTERFNGEDEVDSEVLGWLQQAYDQNC